jgi:hypothetical protein
MYVSYIPRIRTRLYWYTVAHNDPFTVKGARRQVTFDSQNDKYASQLSCDASPEAYL